MLTILLETKVADEEEEQDAMDVAVQERVNYFLKSEPTHNSTATTHIEQFSHLVGQREDSVYVQWQDVHTLAAAKFSRCQRGITYVDLCTGRDKIVQTAKQAQNVLHYWKKKCYLFTYSRRKPQEYFLSKDEAEYYFLKCTHNDTTGAHTRKTDIYSGYLRPSTTSTTLPKPTADSGTTTAIADTFLQSLALAKSQPLAIHNLCFHVRLNNPRPDSGDNPYDRINTCAITEKHNRTKRYEYRRGKTHIIFRAFPNNTVDVYVACSGVPFPLDTQEHVTSLFCFVGAVHDTLRVWLSDTSDTITPPVHDWQLVRADLNRDVRVTPTLHFAMPKMQLRTAEGVFRIYSKRLSDGHFYIRQEKMLPKGAVHSGFKEDAIYELMKNIDTAPPGTPATDPAAATAKNNEEDVACNG